MNTIHGESKMSQTILAQSTASLQLQVYKYSLILSNDTGDTEQTIAAFESVPTSIDWQPWLDNWAILGYTLQGEPQLIKSH
ncbi:MAG: hypothetical protein KME09_07150 [Pleurocapsa minor HA4230-MV1]|jgi:hypothetical protein|nr:hypothetical protein [Pleurocapsa minor HA4230-MV1]